MTEAFVIRCVCGNDLSVPPEAAGKHVRCPHCRVVIPPHSIQLLKRGEPRTRGFSHSAISKWKCPICQRYIVWNNPFRRRRPCRSCGAMLRYNFHWIWLFIPGMVGAAVFVQRLPDPRILRPLVFVYAIVLIVVSMWLTGPIKLAAGFDGCYCPRCWADVRDQIGASPSNCSACGKRLPANGHLVLKRLATDRTAQRATGEP
jgi:hypothetical protein